MSASNKYMQMKKMWQRLARSEYCLALKGLDFTDFCSSVVLYMLSSVSLNFYLWTTFLCVRWMSWGRILGRNWVKGLKSFPPCYSQSPLLKDPPPPVNVTWNWFVHCTQKPQVGELWRLWPETSTKLYVHEFGLCTTPALSNCTSMDLPTCVSSNSAAT